MIFRKKEKKENPAGAALFINNSSAYDFKKDKSVLAREGYCQNIIVYRAVREISDCAASVSIMAVSGGKELPDTHPVHALLRRPNPTQGWDKFCKNVFTDYLITGEMFFVGEGQKPSELWALSPLNMEINPGPGGMASWYVYKNGREDKSFAVERITGNSDVYFQKMYNPLDYWRGMSPLEAASLAGDLHNQGMRWNYGLLKNGAAPSGIVKLPGTPGGETISLLKEYFKKTLQGGKNAGGIPVLVDGAEWQEISKSPKDMDYLNTMKEAAKYVASAYGVPLPLVDNDSASYNNMQQAKERLWTDTVLPLLGEFLNGFSAWLSYKFGQPIELIADADSVPALEGVRQRRFDRMVSAINAGLLSIDEAREEIGYMPKGGNADILMVPASRVPIDLMDAKLNAPNQ